MGILRTDRVSGLGGANAIKGSVKFTVNDGTGNTLGNSLNIFDPNDKEDLNFAGNDFTFEAWVYPYDNVQWSCVYSQAWGLQIYTRTSDSNGAYVFIYVSDADSSSYAISGAASAYKSITANQWNHIAFSRSGNSWTIFTNGTAATSSTSSQSLVSSNADYTIGIFNSIGSAGQDAGSYFGYKGYISNLRIRTGAHYLPSTNFTPPVGELQKTSDTVLLACQSPGDVTKEATGKTIAPIKKNVNDAIPQASRFTPNSPVGFSTTTDVGTQFGSTFDGVTTFDSQAYFVPPGGNTRERNRGRGVLGGGYVHPSVGHNSMMYIEIQTQGNAQDFGDLTVARSYFVAGQTSSSTRGLNSGGFASPGSVNTIDFITIANTANAIDFGDTINTRPSGGLSNQTRSVHAGTTSPFSNVIDFVTIATTGDAQDFGDLVEPQSLFAGASSSTRGVFGGGRNNTPSSNTLYNTMQFITIASTGNAQDFGDLQALRYGHTGFSSPTRGIFAGGYLTPGQTASIDFFTIATLGNSEDFGDLSIGVGYNGSVTNSTRGVITINDAPNYTNALEFITIATTGDAKDFGDADPSGSPAGNGMGDFPSGISDSHGGLE